MLKAVETTYKGVAFRSRLEARWAVFFDEIKVKWEYEPECFDLGSGILYTPDFRVKSGGDTRYCEVKPDISLVSQADWLKMVLFAKQIDPSVHNHGHKLLLLDGPPDLRMYQGIGEIFAPDDGTDSTAKWNTLKPPFHPHEYALQYERSGVCLTSHKGRPWWDEHCNFYDRVWNGDFLPLLEAAVCRANNYPFDKRRAAR